MNIKWRLVLTVIAALVIAILSVGGVAIYSFKTNMQKLTNDTTNSYRELAYHSKKSELKTAVNTAMGSIKSFHTQTSREKLVASLQDTLKTRIDILVKSLEGYYEKNHNTFSESELQKNMLSMVKNVRFGVDGYFWVNDMNSIMLMHPIKPSLDGKNLENLSDVNGKKLFKEFVNVAKTSKQGFVDYMWPKPGFEKPQEKISYVHLFEPYQLGYWNG